MGLGVASPLVPMARPELPHAAAKWTGFPLNPQLPESGDPILIASHLQIENAVSGSAARGAGGKYCPVSAQQHQDQPCDSPPRRPSRPRGDFPAELSKQDST